LKIKARAMPNNSFTHEHYRVILGNALDAGYEFICFDDADERRDTEGVCIMRHDCDNDLSAALNLATIEAAFDVTSTYFLRFHADLYNLLSGPNVLLVRRIMALGHQIGLHFEEHCMPDGHRDDSTLIELVDEERHALESVFGQPVTVVSFHQPSKRILSNHFRINAINTYDRRDLGGFHYLSDSNMRWREGPLEEIVKSRRYPRLHVLIHPEWWTARAMSCQEKWQEMIKNNFELAQANLLLQEEAYNDPFRIRLGEAQ
jgi:hypothetical protein